MLTTHAGALMPHPIVGPAPEIGWLSPMNSGGTAAHANAGSDALLEALDSFYAGVVGYAGQTIVWSIALWDSGAGDASPLLFTDAGAGKVRVEWQGFNGNPAAAPSLGTLTLTATANGVPVPIGQRLLAVASDPTEIAQLDWSPE